VIQPAFFIATGFIAEKFLVVPGTISSFNEIATHGSRRDQRTKGRKTREELKCCVQGKSYSPYI